MLPFWYLRFRNPSKVLREGIDVLGGKEKVIVVGGGMVGCEIAEFISEKSKGQKKIIVVEMLAELASDGDPIDRELLIQRLCEKGIQVHLNMKVDEVRAEGVVTIFKGET